ncbi:VOC family protein [Pedobacter gandavensis]|uniref:VOC family protein n=1 Tax=Pedobacter gandavensis TaxID=2679963 RepID=UPI002931524F|nr:VOC family protein [Pedobacter gandavensis]
MQNNHINYIEFQASDLIAIKRFYQFSFNWSFTDYGPEYIAFSESGLDGGFFKSDSIVKNGALVILYHENLAQVQDKIIEAGGQISKDIFSFPGGRRFHFLDPAGNELAVWSNT